MHAAETTGLLLLYFFQREVSCLVEFFEKKTLIGRTESDKNHKFKDKIHGLPTLRYMALAI